jgi:hypothetical protein
MSPEDEQKSSSSSSLALLLETVNRGVAEYRSGELTGRDVRALAQERRRVEREAWVPIQGALRRRGYR